MSTTMDVALLLGDAWCSAPRGGIRRPLGLSWARGSGWGPAYMDGVSSSPMVHPVVPLEDGWLYSRYIWSRCRGRWGSHVLLRVRCVPVGELARCAAHPAQRRGARLPPDGVKLFATGWTSEYGLARIAVAVALPGLIIIHLFWRRPRSRPVRLPELLRGGGGRPLGSPAPSSHGGSGRACGRHAASG